MAGWTVLIDILCTVESWSKFGFVQVYHLLGMWLLLDLVSWKQSSSSRIRDNA